MKERVLYNTYYEHFDDFKQAIFGFLESLSRLDPSPENIGLYPGMEPALFPIKGKSDSDSDIPRLADCATSDLPDMGMAQMIQLSAASPNPLGVDQQKMNLELDSIMQELAGGAPLELDNPNSDIPSFDDSGAPAGLNELGVDSSGFGATFDSILESLESFK